MFPHLKAEKDNVSKTLRFLIILNSERRTKSRNRVILNVIHHLHNYLKSKNYLHLFFEFKEYYKN
jgi:hypothetical protein